MRRDLEQLYRDAIAMMDVSTDARIEKLRRVNISSSIEKERASPELVAKGAKAGQKWAEKAFEDLYAGGFIVTDWMEYFWFAPTQKALDERMTVLAGMEAMAIVRLSSMDCGEALPGIKNRLHEFQQEAEGGDLIRASLARQRLMLTVVGAIGPQRLAEDYVKAAKVAVAYAAAAKLNKRSLNGMRKSAEKLVMGLGGKDVRNCAAEAVAMRLHPSEPIGNRAKKLVRL